jgi:hypothetical protein
MAPNSFAETVALRANDPVLSALTLPSPAAFAHVPLVALLFAAAVLVGLVHRETRREPSLARRRAGTVLTPSPASTG